MRSSPQEGIFDLSSHEMIWKTCLTPAPSFGIMSSLNRHNQSAGVCGPLLSLTECDSGQIAHEAEHSVGSSLASDDLAGKHCVPWRSNLSQPLPALLKIHVGAPGTYHGFSASATDVRAIPLLSSFPLAPKRALTSGSLEKH